MKPRKAGRSTTKTYFRNILPKTDKSKSLDYYKFGFDDNLGVEIIEAINNSGAAKKSAKKYSEYVQADGFASELAAKYPVSKSETADKILSKAATALSYFSAVAFHIARSGDGKVAEIKILPNQKLRRKLDGNWLYNKTIGTEKVDKNDWVEYQKFKGTIASPNDMADNVNNFGGRGEVLYVFDGNPFDSDIYAIPDFMASFEDLKTSSELSKMDLEAVLNGFVLGGMVTFVGVNDTEKDEAGLTDRDKTDDAMMQFTGLKKNAMGLSNRFAVMTNYVDTPEQIPTYAANDPKPILEATNTKREIIDRAVCRLWGVHPVLIGYSEASILGNDKAMAQAVDLLKATVNPLQRLLTGAFEKMFGTQIDWTISEVRNSYIDPALYPDMTVDERRNLLSLAPLVNTQTLPNEQ